MNPEYSSSDGTGNRVPKRERQDDPPVTPPSPQEAPPPDRRASPSENPSPKKTKITRDALLDNIYEYGTNLSVPDFIRSTGPIPMQPSPPIPPHMSMVRSYAPPPPTIIPPHMIRHNAPRLFRPPPQRFYPLPSGSDGGAVTEIIRNMGNLGLRGNTTQPPFPVIENPSPAVGEIIRSMGNLGLRDHGMATPLSPIDEENTASGDS